MTISECYCINLYERDDRMQEAKKVFEKYDLPVKFYRVYKDTESGKRGCFTSHVNIIKEAYDKQLDNILIFEDDIVCNLTKEEFDKKMVDVYDFIDKNDYDIFFLGSIPDIFNKTVTKISKNIYQVNSYCTHAYILSKTGIEKYKDLVYADISIDFIYLDSNNAFAMYPSIFYQNESKSDIAPSWFNYHGFKNNSVKLREYYAMHVNIPLSWPIVLLIISSLIAFFITKKLIFLILPILYLGYHLLKY